MRRAFWVGGPLLAAHACLMHIPDSPTCDPGTLVDCYDGPPETLDTGNCKAGATECQQEGAPGTCTGQVVPELEQCSSKVPLQDEDCNGAVNEHCAVWAALYGGYGTQYMDAMAVAANFDVVLLADNNGELNFGGEEFESGPWFVRAAVARLDPTGQHVWSKRFGSITRANVLGEDVALDEELGLLVVGSFESELHYEDEFQVLGDDLSKSIFVARLDDDGTGRKFAAFGDSEAQEGYAVAAGPGVVVFGGAAAGTTDFGPVGLREATAGGYDAVVAKLDPDLVPLWARVDGGQGEDVAKRVGLDDDGNVYVAGWFTTELDLGDACDPLIAEGPSDAFVAKLAGGNGDCLWVHAFSGSGDEHATALTYHDRLYVGVTYTGSLSDDDLQGESLGDTDILVAVLDPNSGATVARRTFGAPRRQEIHDLAVDASGFVAVVGSIGGSIDMGGGLMNVPDVDPAMMQDDAYVMLLDPDLQHVFSRHFSGDRDDDAFSVAFTQNDELWVAGELDGTIDFGQGLQSSYGADVFLMRMSR